MPVEKLELFERAKELGLEPKEGTPKHILQRMINKAEDSVPPIITEDPDGALEAVNIVVGETIAHPANIREEIEVAYAPKPEFDAAMDADIRKRVAAQMREEEIRKELHAQAALERKKNRELKKYELTYDIHDLVKQAEEILGRRGKFTIQMDRGTYHIVVGQYACSGNLAQERRFILRDCQHAISLKPAKTRINDLGQVQFTSDLDELRV